MSSNIKIKKINSEISSIIIDEQKTYNSLSFQNLNDLLKAFKKLDNDKQLKVIILGNRPLKKNLNKIIKLKKLSTKIFIKSFDKRLFSILC